MTDARIELHMEIRPARIEDLPSIVAIYNQGVAARTATGDITPVSVEDRTAWFKEHSPGTHPIIVAETGGVITGWGSLSGYRAGRMAFAKTVEISYYIHEDFRRMGIASMLVEHLLELSPKLGYAAVLAIILSRNTASAALLEKYGFTQWGRLPGVAEIDGVVMDHLYYGRSVSV